MQVRCIKPCHGLSVGSVYKAVQHDELTDAYNIFTSQGIPLGEFFKVSFEAVENEPTSKVMTFISSSSDLYGLTRGKNYNVSENGEYLYSMYNDLGKMISVGKQLFVEPGKYRDAQLISTQLMKYVGGKWAMISSLTIGKNYHTVPKIVNGIKMVSLVDDYGINVNVNLELFKPVTLKYGNLFIPKLDDHHKVINLMCRCTPFKPIQRTEAQQLVHERSNGAYDQISNDAKKIMDILGNDDNFTYFYSQIANKLARMKHGYSVEDSILDIAGYAELELEKLRTLSASE